MSAEAVPLFFANLVHESLLNISPQRDRPGESFFAVRRQIEKAPAHSAPGRHCQKAEFFEPMEAAGQGRRVGDQNFRNSANRNRLGFGDGGENGELGGPETALLEGIIKERGHGSGNTAKMERRAVSRAGQVKQWGCGFHNGS